MHLPPNIITSCDITSTVIWPAVHFCLANGVRIKAGSAYTVLCIHACMYSTRLYGGLRISSILGGVTIPHTHMHTHTHTLTLTPHSLSLSLTLSLSLSLSHSLSHCLSHSLTYSHTHTHTLTHTHTQCMGSVVLMVIFVWWVVAHPTKDGSSTVRTISMEPYVMMDYGMMQTHRSCVPSLDMGKMKV